MKANNATEKVILDYFEKNASDDLKKRVEAEKKTIEGALKYCSSQARKHQVGNCACVDDETVFGWVMHYFEDEDAKKWEKSPETAKVKASAAKKKPAAKKPEEKKEPGWKKASAEGRRRAAEQRKAEAEAKDAETAKVDNVPQNALEAEIDRATGYKPGDEARTEVAERRLRELVILPRGDVVVDEITAHHIKTRIHQNEYARYLEYAEQAGWDMDDPHVYLPPKRRWKARLEHAEAEANAVEERKLKLAEKEVNEKILKVALKFAKLTEYRRGKFSLEIPTCCNELRAEGKKMGNCIGSMGYDRKTINGESLMLFVRKDGDFYSDIEIDRRNQRIRQHYAKKNSKPDRWAASFADEIVKRYRRIERKLRRSA